MTERKRMHGHEFTCAQIAAAIYDYRCDPTVFAPWDFTSSDVRKEWCRWAQDEYGELSLDLMRAPKLGQYTSQQAQGEAEDVIQGQHAIEMVRLAESVRRSLEDLQIQTFATTINNLDANPRGEIHSPDLHEMLRSLRYAHDTLSRGMQKLDALMGTKP